MADRGIINLSFIMPGLSALILGASPIGTLAEYYYHQRARPA